VGAQAKPSRRHHHVWQHYLKPWSTGGAIWCRQDGERVFTAGTRVVAVETDFYKLHDLTPADIAFVRWLLSKSHSLAQRNNDHLLAKLLRPFELARKAERDGNPVMRTVWMALADQFAADALEFQHAQVEALAIPLLESAQKGDLSFYEDERAIGFLYFLATQHLRTKGVKERSIERCKADGSADLTRVWNILIPMFATTLGSSLYLARRDCPLTLIHNDTDVPFITGDQPTINLLASPLRERSPEKLSLYYPIAPDLALLLPEVGESPMFPATGLSREQATALNERLAQASYRQVFGVSEASLRALSPATAVA